MSGPCFDRIAVVDWSARATPTTGADSIWIAVSEQRAGPDPDAQHDNSTGAALSLTNPATRREALGALSRLAVPGRRTLLGVDFSLGYPAGTAAACGLTGLAWQSMWAHLGAEIVDDDRNRNNRFDVASRLNALIDRGPGPFWGCPPTRESATLTSTKPGRAATWPAEWRVVESQLRASGRRPFSAWQLLGAGAVGGQSLVGIAALERLRWNLGRRLAIWPFTTGLDLPARDATELVDAAELVVAEVWPSMWDVAVPVGVVKDAAQVEATARRFAALDASGDLANMFRVDLEPDVERAVTEEEGWVLGVPGTLS